MIIEYPEITVLMSVYNSEKYLKECIESVLNQTFGDFEFLIINDASTDNSRDIILSYKDNRIKLIDNDVNIGLTKSLNKGIKLSKGKYIARMDADDVCVNSRFINQLNYMNENHKCIVCGTWAELIDENDNYLGELKYPVNNDKIRNSLFFYNCIVHSSVIIRKNILLDNSIFYDEEYKQTQDYDLWCRLTKYGEFYNYPKVLVEFRKHSNSISNIKSEMQINNYYQITFHYILGVFKLDNEDIKLIIKINERTIPSLTNNEIVRIYELFNKMLSFNKYYEDSLRKVVIRYWKWICLLNKEGKYLYYKYNFDDRNLIINWMIILLRKFINEFKN